MPRIKVSKAKLWKVIRQFCLKCVFNSKLEIELCTDTECSLYPYRFGRPSQESDTRYIPGSHNKYQKNGKIMAYIDGKGWQDAKEVEQEQT